MNTPYPLSRYFQASYEASRSALLLGLARISRRHTVVVDSRSVSALTGEHGPNGETLALDFCMIGARQPKHVLMVSCGTHGLEGYVGSAVQHYLIDQVLPTLRLPADTAIVLLHAINPYGFAWGRRVNEHNVDLNRNFGAHDTPPPCDPDYDALFALLNPTKWTPSSRQRDQAALQAFVDEHGLRRLQTAFSAGQYHYPQGVQFGGQTPQASTVLLRALFTEHFAHARTMLWLDFHTGLGEFAACELITGALKDSAEYRFSNQVWSEGVKSAQSGESVSATLNGLLDRGLIPALPPGCQVAFAFPEYGTYETRRVMDAVCADNWLQHHGLPRDTADAFTQELRRECKEMFSPDSREWEHRVVAHGAHLVQEALHQLGLKTPA
jgi:Protein of unknown function (DUF2817)